MFEITFIMPVRNVTIVAEDDEFILDAAWRQDLDLHCQCRDGYCEASACKLLEGNVDKSDAVRIFTEDIRVGFVLICTAKPLSNVKLLTHQKEAMQDFRIEHNLPTTRG